MSNIYFSAKNNGFYSDSLRATYEDSANGWPTDARAVSDDEYLALIEGQASGKIIIPNSKGKPMLSAPPAQTKAQLIMAAEALRDDRLDVAKDKIIVYQTKLAIGRTLTDDEKARLNMWLDYIDAVNAIDTSIAPDITWPEEPR